MMTDIIEKNVSVDGAVGNEGECNSSTFSMAQGLPVGPLGPGQRWSAGRKREVVLRLLRAEPMELLSRELGVEIFRLDEWRNKALAGIDAALKQRNDGAPMKAELDAALKRIGASDGGGPHPSRGPAGHTARGASPSGPRFKCRHAFVTRCVTETSRNSHRTLLRRG